MNNKNNHEWYYDDIREDSEILELAMYSVESYIPSNVIQRVINYLEDYDKLRSEHGWDVPEWPIEDW